jgi:hypothetical protein
MAVRKTNGTQPQPFPGDEIILERKIFIGRIAPSPDGSESMIAAAFLAIGQYMAENDDQEGYEIEFTWGGRTFATALAPDPVFIEGKRIEQEDWDATH